MVISNVFGVDQPFRTYLNHSTMQETRPQVELDMISYYTLVICQEWTILCKYNLPPSSLPSSPSSPVPSKASQSLVHILLLSAYTLIVCHCFLHNLLPLILLVPSIWVQGYLNPLGEQGICGVISLEFVVVWFNHTEHPWTTNLLEPLSPKGKYKSSRWWNSFKPVQIILPTQGTRSCLEFDMSLGGLSLLKPPRTTELWREQGS